MAARAARAGTGDHRLFFGADLTCAIEVRCLWGEVMIGVRVVGASPTIARFAGRVSPQFYSLALPAERKKNPRRLLDRAHQRSEVWMGLLTERGVTRAQRLAGTPYRSLRRTPDPMSWSRVVRATPFRAKAAMRPKRGWPTVSR